MRYFKAYLFVLFCLFLGASIPAIAQKTKFKKGGVVNQNTRKDSLQQQAVNLQFKNINKINYYKDQSKFEEIKSLDKHQQWEELYPKLKEYVSNFGIKNFNKDTYWLWRLAKLTELFGNMEEAKSLYKLSIKHSGKDLNAKSIELYYDSLSENEVDYYVPIEYYYELVEFRRDVDTLRPPRGILLNMGDVVNSRFEDYGPTIGKDKNVLYFTSKRNKKEKPIDDSENEDLFYSINYDGYWDIALPVKGLNSRYNEGSACLTKDGKQLYFSRCECGDCFGNCDIFVAELLPDSTWGNVTNLGLNVNSNAWDSQPSLSHTQDTLFFASDRMGGFGLSDLYYSVKTKRGWSPAKNMGPSINTIHNEVSPFYHPVYPVLYFSSNGQLLNFGDFDIYKTKKLNDGWEEPKNIGPLVNGPGFEYYFTIDPESNLLFYARSEGNDKKNLDLYSFPLPMEAQPTASTKLRGSLKDSLTGKPFEGIVSIIDLDHGVEVAPKFLRPDGSFEFDLIDRNNYLIIIQGDEFFRIEQVIFLNGDTQFDRETAPITSKLKFSSIEFEESKANILPEMRADLNKVVNFLLDNPEFNLKISGHTDSGGDPDSNLKLSQKRAEAIKDYLVLVGGIDEARVESLGFGSSRPIVPEVTEEDKKLNRRVEFEISRQENP